ncbi:hypothetical protein [Tepidibacillus marianensis]|uniref:hypothetical protein n=1 Tax=Tepidibacillus marianensis TaxID=3131995 RepID=UPI0030D0CD0B
MYLGIALIAFSPYLAVLPVIYMLYHLLHNREKLFLGNAWSMGLFLLFIWSSFVSLINNQFLSFLASFGILAF